MEPWYRIIQVNALLLKYVISLRLGLLLKGFFFVFPTAKWCHVDWFRVPQQFFQHMLDRLEGMVDRGMVDREKGTAFGLQSL